MKYQTKTLAWLLAGTLFLSAAGSSSVPNVKAADITPATGANIVLKASPATLPAITATTPAISASPSVSPSATPGTSSALYLVHLQALLRVQHLVQVLY